MTTSRPDVFLSYSRTDQATARLFAEALEREGLSVWWDQTLHSGENYDQVTEAALRGARAVAVLWSKTSVDSRWVRAEATTADRLGTLAPVMIESCDRPIMFELKHTADLAHWKGNTDDPAWRAYVADLHRLIGGAAPAQPAPVAASANHRAMVIATVIALALIGAVLWWKFRPGTEVAAPEVQASAAVTTAAAAPVTLAVLPFVNLSADPEQEYFSDGLTEEILNQLAQIKALRVTGRTSSFAFKGKNEDLRVIGEKLGVGNLLEGSVRRDGETLRITAQLIDAKDGAHLWSKTYDREFSKVLSVQEEVARDVAQALSITLDVGEISRAEGGTTNLAAWDAYLRGRQFLFSDEREASAQAMRWFREATRLDPMFAQAWLGLITALQSRRLFVGAEAEALTGEMNSARESVRRLPSPVWWTGVMNAIELSEERKWAAAEAELDRAVAASAGRQWQLEQMLVRITFLINVGRVREALLLGEQATAQDPLALILARPVQQAMDFAGRPADAEAEYLRTRRDAGVTGPTEYWRMARMLMRDDITPAEVRAQARVLQKTSSRPVILLGYLADHYSSRAAALPEVRKAFEDPVNNALVPMWATSMYADRFGDADLALAALRKAVFGPQGGPAILWFPQRTVKKSDTRFKDIVREVGLLDYWRQSSHWGDYCAPVGADDFECH